MVKRKHNIESVVKLGTNLFWERGYYSVGTQELITKTKMTRGAFYNSFESKEHYLIACINSYAEELLQDISVLYVDETKSPLNRLKTYYTKAIITLPQEGYKGCFLHNISSEVGGTNANVAAIIEKHNNKILSAVENCVLQALRANEIPNMLNSREVAQLVHYAYLGAITQAKTTKTNTEGLGTLRALFQLLSS